MDWIPAIWADPITDWEAMIYDSQVMRRDGGEGPVEGLEFVVSDERRNAATDSRVRGIEASFSLQKSRKRVDRFEDGWIGGRYRVTEFAAHRGLVVPLSFEFIRFTVTGQILEKFVGEVRKLEDCLRTDFVPEIPAVGISVQDVRFKNEQLDYILYNVTGNRWPAVDDTTLLATYSNRLASPRQIFHPDEVGMSSFVRWVFVVVIVAVISAIPVYRYRWQRLSGKEK